MGLQLSDCLATPVVYIGIYQRLYISNCISKYDNKETITAEKLTLVL